MKLVFSRRWEAGHRLTQGENRNSKCYQPHGHSWNVTVYLKSKTPVVLDQSENCIVPFDKAKKQWHQWIDEHIDHSFMFNSEDPLLQFMLKDNPEGRHVVFPGDPTTEMIAVTFKAKLESILEEHCPKLMCEKILISETCTNAVEFDGYSSEMLKTPKETLTWWQKSDMSTR